MHGHVPCPSKQKVVGTINPVARALRHAIDLDSAKRRTRFTRCKRGPAAGGSAKQAVLVSFNAGVAPAC